MTLKKILTYIEFELGLELGVLQPPEGHMVIVIRPSAPRMSPYPEGIRQTTSVPRHTDITCVFFLMDERCVPLVTPQATLTLSADKIDVAAILFISGWPFRLKECARLSYINLKTQYQHMPKKQWIINDANKQLPWLLQSTDLECRPFIQPLF